MPDVTEWIDYFDEHAGWENTTWRFVRGAWDGEDIPAGADHDLIHVMLNFVGRADIGTQYEGTTTLENGSLYYRASSPTGEGKFCGFIRYNNPTNDYCHIKFNGYKLQNNSVVSMNYSLSSALNGVLSWSDGPTVDVTQEAANLGARNDGSTIGLSYDYEFWQFRKNSTNVISISADFPIFKDWESLEKYIKFGDLDGCINLIPKYEPKTEPYFIYNEYGPASQLRGSVTSTGAKAWRSLKMLCNEPPVLYYGANNYALYLDADGLVSSVTAEKPGYFLDLIPQTQWTAGLAYTGNFYGYFSQRNAATGYILPDGNYAGYGFTLSTNVYIFKNKADADEARRKKEYKKAINYEDIDDRKPKRPKLPDEGNTDFGGGADTSPFVTAYILTRTNVAAIANEWYNTDGQILQNILDGLKMYSNPTDAIAGLTWYPFDVSSLVISSATHKLAFGSYEMNLPSSTFYKIDGNKSGAYIDCGGFDMPYLFKDYRDFEPFTHVSLYLPYIGWKDIDQRPLIGKHITIRYYVDLHTRACIAAILANGTFITYYNGNIGVGLPISAPDFQGYANNAFNSILKGASGALNPTQAIQAGSAGGPVAAAGVAATGIAKSTFTAAFEVEKLGQPRDHLITKGNFTGGLGSYMPQYILWRYDIHDPMEPSNFNELYGRPTSTSGPVSNYGGFLKVKTAKLNTGGMLDSEVAEVASLLKSGIFV